MSHSRDDHRDSALVVPYSFPNTWYRDSTEVTGMSGMMLSGLIMVTRNRFIAWPAVLFGLNQVVNAHPMRNKEGGTGWSNLALTLSALVASYLPMFMITNKPV